MSRSRRSILTFGGGVVYTGVTVTIGFLTVPYLLHWLGTESFGACRALTDWYSQFKLLELGLGASLLPRLAKATGREDAQEVHQVLGAGIRAYLGLGRQAFLPGRSEDSAWLSHVLPGAEVPPLTGFELLQQPVTWRP